MAWRLLDFVVLDEHGNLTSETFEELVQGDVTELHSTNGRVAVRKQIQRIANTPTLWGDSRARYDAALGQMVTSQRDIDRICLEKGLTPVNDLPVGTQERMYQQQIDHHNHYQKVDERWHTLAAKHGLHREDGTIDPAAAERVWEEHAPAKEILNGTWDGALQLSDF